MFEIMDCQLLSKLLSITSKTKHERFESSYRLVFVHSKARQTYSVAQYSGKFCMDVFVRGIRMLGVTIPRFLVPKSILSLKMGLKNACSISFPRCEQKNSTHMCPNVGTYEKSYLVLKRNIGDGIF